MNASNHRPTGSPAAPRSIRTMLAVALRTAHRRSGRGQATRTCRIVWREKRSGASPQILYGLGGARGIVAASGDVSRAGFSAYVGPRDLPARADLDASVTESEKCPAAGCDEYSTTPIDKPLLLAMCARWLGHSGGTRTVTC